MFLSADYLYKFILFGALIYSCCEEIAGTSTLKAVSMITRHGDRAPEYGYTSDPYANYPWPGGLGALSPRGVRQLYRSGMIKSKRYSSLLTPMCLFCRFDLNKMYVQSSEYPRCIASAQSFLAGFLPGAWQESMINVTPKNEDEFLGMAKPCPKYPFSVSEYFDLSDPAYAEIIDFQSDAGKQFLAYMENVTGLVGGNVFMASATLTVQLDNGLALPEWAENIYDRYLEPIVTIGINLFNKSPFMKIRSGVLLKDIVDRLQNFLSGSSSTNILFYSGHDSNVNGMLHLLDVADQDPVFEYPMYGSMVVMEVYENTDVTDDFEIKIVYFGKYGDENPIELKIPNCPAPCPFRKFLATVQPKLVLDHDAACSQNNNRV